MSPEEKFYDLLTSHLPQKFSTSRLWSSPLRKHRYSYSSLLKLCQKQLKMYGGDGKKKKKETECMFLQCNIGTFSVQNKTAVLGEESELRSPWSSIEKLIEP